MIPIGTTTLKRMWLQPAYLLAPSMFDRSAVKGPILKGLIALELGANHFIFACVVRADTLCAGNNAPFAPRR
jgi:hypothetical protein